MCHKILLTLFIQSPRIKICSQERADAVFANVWEGKNVCCLLCVLCGVSLSISMHLNEPIFYYGLRPLNKEISNYLWHRAWRHRLLHVLISVIENLRNQLGKWNSASLLARAAVAFLVVERRRDGDFVVKPEMLLCANAAESSNDISSCFRLKYNVNKCAKLRTSFRDALT